VHPEIANPDYDPKAADKLHHVCAPCGAVGFELWQVQAGTLFDDIYVGDSVAEAEAFAAATFGAKKDGEKKAFDALEAEKKAKEEADRKAAEDAAKAKKADDDKEDDDKDEL
jgi:calreticulin